jgi:hypothetical protein
MAGKLKTKDIGTQRRKQRVAAQAVTPSAPPTHVRQPVKPSRWRYWRNVLKSMWPA